MKISHSQCICCKFHHHQAATYRQEQLYVIKQKHPRQKTIKFTSPSLALLSSATMSALLAKFLLNALKKWYARHPSEI